MAHVAGDKSWLDKMGAELVTVQNSSFTCRGMKGSSGGSMIDYIIISEIFIPLVVHVLAAMDAPWGPHFGISRKMFSNPDDILVRVLVKPALPNNYIELLKLKPKAK